MSKSNSDELRAKVNKLLDFFTEPGTGEKYLKDLENDLVELIQSEISKREQLLLDELEATYRGQIIPVDNKDMVKLADVQSIYRGIKDFINAKRGKK